MKPILDSRKITQLLESAQALKTDFTSFNVATATYLSEKTSFEALESHTEKQTILHKLSIILNINIRGNNMVANKNILQKSTAQSTWWMLSLASLVGLLASIVQTIERIEYAKNAKLALRCDINSVFSCSSVFDAWQSSVFGFSNSIMCIVFFAISLGAAMAALSGSSLHKNYRLVLWGASVFFLGFGAWYIWQSAYVINALCIFCIFCYGAVIAMNWAWLRINSPLLGGSSWGKKLQVLVSKNVDTYVWLGYSVVFATIIAWRFV